MNSAVEIENIPLYDEHPSFIKGRPFKFLICLALVPLLVGIPVLFLCWLEQKAERFTIVDGEIKYKRGLLVKTTMEIPLSAIRTVSIKQGILDRLFGVGFVEIYTSGDKPEITSQGLPNPELIRQFT